ncbi:hypothetical protein AB7Z32_21325 [Bradyrhizobium sp. 482_C4_N1_1]|uniref:hypothetical protein n=1 Tax=unclassified Bradyrhizobium TaxID=2631580 RepID=UPI0033967A18
MGTKAKAEHTPEQRAAAAERARMLKSPSRRADQDRMLLIGEKLGLTRFAEDLKKRREGETVPPVRQEPTAPERKRGRGAGRKRSIPQEQIERGIDILQSQDRMTVEAARATLRAGGIEGEDGPLYRLIIKPAYAGMSK